MKAREPAVNDADGQAIADALDHALGELRDGIDPVVAAASRRVLESTEWDDPAPTPKSGGLSGR